MAHTSSDYAVICERCRRPARRLESWLERRRLRTTSPAQLGGFSYGHRIVEHLVCPSCYLEVRRGRPTVVNRGYRIIGLAVAAALLLAAGLPALMPNLLSAFWVQAPTSWREPHMKGRPVALQGRY